MDHDYYQKRHLYNWEIISRYRLLIRSITDQLSEEMGEREFWTSKVGKKISEEYEVIGQLLDGVNDMDRQIKKQ